jgi:hypothetical protein
MFRFKKEVITRTEEGAAGQVKTRSAKVSFSLGEVSSGFVLFGYLSALGIDSWFSQITSGLV